MNPLMEPFLYEAAIAHQCDLRAVASATAPADAGRAAMVDVGREARERTCTTPCLWRLLTVAR